MNLKNGKVFTSIYVGTGPSSYEKRIYRAAVSQRLRNNVLEHGLLMLCSQCPGRWYWSVSGSAATTRLYRFKIANKIVD